VAGKVTVGLASHWPCVIDFSGLTTHKLKAYEGEMSCNLPMLQWSVAPFITLPAGAVAKYFDENVCLSVCVCVCLSARISPEPCAIFTKFFVHVAYARGLVLVPHVDDRRHRLSAGRG